MAKEKKNSAADTEQAQIKKEEHSRRAKRTSRQLIGLGLSILILVGAVSIVQGSINLVKQMLDTTSEQQEYEKRVASMVWFDMLPFENLSEVDPNSLIQIAIWGVMEQEKSNLNRTTQGEPMVPAVEVERYLVSLFGPNVPIAEHTTFTDTVYDLTYVFDETQQVYIAPNTGLQPPFLPVVVDIVRESGGIRRVVVGYVNTMSNNNELINTPDFNHPARYMDYIFQRDGSSYYLIALRKNTSFVPPQVASAPDQPGNMAASEVEEQVVLSTPVEMPASVPVEQEPAEESTADSAPESAESAS